MKKVRLGAGTYLIPMPVVLVGALVDGRPNFLTIAYCGVVSYKPPMIEVGLRKGRYTSAGIRENGTFSVNIPSEELIEATDYCGIVSGSKIDKSKLFEVFYGELETAPMISECPLNLECRLVQVLDLGGTHEVFIGEIVETHAGVEYVDGGRPDTESIKPFVFSASDDSYWGLGEKLAEAFKVGKGFTNG